MSAQLGTQLRNLFAVERGGAEPAVVFVHGFCQSSAYWTPTLHAVAAKGVRGIAVDLPGFAASAGEDGPYTMPGLADVLARDLDRRGLAKIVLVCGSMGGVVAQHFALRHPARVERLLLVATGGFTPNVALALEKTAAMAAAPWVEETIVPVVDGFFYKRPPAEKIAEYRKIALSASQTAAVEAARSNANNRSFDSLGSIRVPTMIVQGRHDKARTPEHGAEMRERIPGCALEVIEDAGHTPNSSNRTRSRR